MKPRYSFSSRRTRHIDNITKQRPKFPDLLEQLIEEADILLEVLDSRFLKETRNFGVERRIKSLGKRLILVNNKCDLVLKNPTGINVSCLNRRGIKELREIIKIKAKQLKKVGRVKIGIIGYPNTGKSSLINSLVGKSSAGTGKEEGFTKGLQKLRLSKDISLIDSPGVIPRREYSSSDLKKFADQAKIGIRSYPHVRNPEMAVARIFEEYEELFKKFYKEDFKGDSEKLIETIGKKRNFFIKGGFVDEKRAAKSILKDWQEGKIKPKF